MAASYTRPNRPHNNAFLFCLLYPISLVNAFHQAALYLVQTKPFGLVPPSRSEVHLLNDGDGKMIGEEMNPTNTDDTASFFRSLQKRQADLNRGIGRRYVTRTQRGFLNVHEDPKSGPYAVDNIVGRLEEGEIVTSLGKFEDWIEHDGGGWSIAEFGGFTWLELLEE